MAMIVMIIFLSVSSSISVPTADKLKPPPNLTNENPSSSLPTQNNNPITPPIVTPPHDVLTSIPSLPASQAELSLTSQPELQVQTLELHIPPSRVRALTSQPELQVQTLELHIPPSRVRALTSQPELQVQTLELHIPPSRVRALTSQPELQVQTLELHIPPSRVRALTSQPELQVQTLELHIPPFLVRALTSQPELQVQTLELHIPPSPVRASPPQPTNQSGTTSLSAHATQGGQESQDNSLTAPQLANEIQRAGPSGHANPPLRFFPLYRRPLQSPIQRIPFQPSFLPIRVPWYQHNAFMAHDGGQHPNEYHRMDRLSRCVLNYFLAGGLSYTSSWTERPTLSTSIYIQCFLNQVAFSLFLLAHFVFPRTNPPIAFIMDRASFSLIVLSGYLSTMPMYPPYVAIIMLLVVVMVYIFSRRRG